MNKKLIIPVLLVSLLVPFSARAHVALSTAAVAGTTVGVVGGVALIAGLLYHDYQKHHHPDEYCNKHPNRRSCVEREQGKSSVSEHHYRHHHHAQQDSEVQA